MVESRGPCGRSQRPATGTSRKVQLHTLSLISWPCMTVLVCLHNLPGIVIAEEIHTVKLQCLCQDALASQGPSGHGSLSPLC